jgi:predicted enzyme related to lactoylglutathione lyase
MRRLEAAMARVIGVGGVFFKCREQQAVQEWYARVLGLPFEPWGGVIFLPQAAASHAGAATVFAPFGEDTTYLAPSTHEFMINLMVDDLDGVLARCREHGVTPVQVLDDQPNGRFAHILDPEGRKIELWQPAPMDG